MLRKQAFKSQALHLCIVCAKYARAETTTILRFRNGISQGRSAKLGCQVGAARTFAFPDASAHTLSLFYATSTNIKPEARKAQELSKAWPSAAPATTEKTAKGSVTVEQNPVDSIKHNATHTQTDTHTHTHARTHAHKLLFREA